ncbi:exo-beta-N-acetylmuramidase NamZ family protein [Flexithrix dorotheae]|uniref:exo-beta-N-acetylmuramidase NamZ family protein n=1 Tax=Flexithrix dorotheae TaxID=70993 RepID=UPI000367F873|nr:DUF1343 domain-containing protein [Flexithrix dorotheae]
MKLFNLLLISFFILGCKGNVEKEEEKITPPPAETEKRIIVGAEKMDSYLSTLKGKNIGLVVNQTSVVNGVHLVDTLLSLGIEIKKVFAPEHGFRGEADAGAHIDNSIDPKTNIPIISIYGKNKKPSADHLKDIDVIIFDIQDVGTRFYTYISTMHYVMEAAAENGKKVLVLDRPNPNGDYIAGPILDPKFKSFVGMHPIPIVHGLTVGELAKMINGEKWLEGKLACELEVIPIEHYDHKMPYELPIAPSPNLPNQQAIRLYPSLCLFEATVMSIGRGTDFPFQVIGYPDENFGDFSFTPVSMPGKSTHPKNENKKCFGVDLRNADDDLGLSLEYLVDFAQKYKGQDFINRGDFFNLLAGNDVLQKQIKDGLSEAEIKATWNEGLDQYKTLRKKYLLYQDFE